ncbi:hypothetical protein CERSUDRAFT_100249 [Gelatoporia subvermispora B]|uniref:Uncharacterized protein n=1 Tax=Ceriporiopsis subvermispora (strain B) TaxID=914234 RepID=M2P888_CERS8|nr:hypothetical protein CERSUDRAFT_100249 [Gelatoporia subvermispora B]
MRFSAVVQIAISLAAVAFGAAQGAVSVKRQMESNHGTGDLATPADGTVISSGATYNFGYENVNGCESGYSPITVWILASPPVFADLNTTGEFNSSDCLFSYGEYLIPNFGLPAMSSPPPPPSTLEMPDLGVPSGDVYLAVVESLIDCPPDIPLEYSLTFNTISYEV